MFIIITLEDTPEEPEVEEPKHDLETGYFRQLIDYSYSKDMYLKRANIYDHEKVHPLRVKVTRLVNIPFKDEIIGEVVLDVKVESCKTGNEYYTCSRFLR